MTDELLKEDKPQTIKIGEKEYHISPLTLNVMVGLEEEFDCSLSDIGDLLTKRQATTLRKLLYILLKDGYPELTKDGIGKMVRVEDLEQISTMVGKALTER